jgi:hypothetical protein
VVRNWAELGKPHRVFATQVTWQGTDYLPALQAATDKRQCSEPAAKARNDAGVRIRFFFGRSRWNWLAGLTFVAGWAFVKDSAGALGDDHDVGRFQSRRVGGICVNDPDLSRLPIAAGVNAQTNGCSAESG